MAEKPQTNDDTAIEKAASAGRDRRPPPRSSAPMWRWTERATRPAAPKSRDQVPDLETAVQAGNVEDIMVLSSRICWKVTEQAFGSFTPRKTSRLLRSSARPDFRSPAWRGQQCLAGRHKVRQ
jgi:hypothetical protein